LACLFLVVEPTPDWAVVGTRVDLALPPPGLDAWAVDDMPEFADVPPCCVQEAMNAMPIRAMINAKTDFFIGMVKVEEVEWPSTRPMASNKIYAT
jgi:hypothetical protein